MPRNKSEKVTPTIAYLREWYTKNPDYGYDYSPESRYLYDALSGPERQRLLRTRRADRLKLLGIAT